MIKPFYKIGDSRNLKKYIKKANVIITSPPYWDLKDYGVDNQIGIKQDYKKGYLSDLEKVFSDCYDILTDDGSLWIVIDTIKKKGSIKPLPFDLSNRLQAKGWKLQDIIIWKKKRTLPFSSKGKMRNIFEYILFFTKNKDFKYNIDMIRKIKLKKWWVGWPERYNPKGKVPERIWNIDIPTQGAWNNNGLRHFCPFPPELVERILFLTTDEGDIVFDPFAGSGSVLAQAEVMNRKAVGLDLNPKYKDMFEGKVRDLFKENWTERQIKIEEEKNEGVKLRITIKKLRQIKLTKSILRDLKSNIKLAVLISRANSPEPAVYLVTKDKGVINRAYKLNMEDKFRKFKLKPKFKVISEKRIKNLFKNKLYLYKNSKQNYNREIKVLEWFTMSEAEKKELISKSGVPPILSNLAISKKDIRINN